MAVSSTVWPRLASKSTARFFPISQSNEPEAFAALVASAKKALEYLKNTSMPNAFEGAVR